MVFMMMAILFGSNVSAESENRVYTFSIVPQFNASRMHAIWRPILAELQRRTGLQFSLHGSTSIPEFEKKFKAGTFDFVYMNPYHILAAHEQQGYVPLLRDIGSDLYGIVVVRKDSPIKQLQDLQGKLMAFPAPNALGASLIIRSDFRNKHNIMVIPRYVQTHGSVYLNVILGEVDAGGGVQKTLAQQRPEIRNALRVLYETKHFAPHPISIHPRVPSKVKELVKNTFLAMNSTSQGRQLLSNIPMVKIGLATMKDYVPISQLDFKGMIKK